MNILIDIGHPAHVHLFKNFICLLKQREHQVFVIAKNISAAEELLDLYGIKYFSLGKKSDAIGGKLVNQFKYDFQLYRIIKEKNINYGIGSSITLSHISKITKMRSFIFDDDDASVEPLFTKFCHPFADYIISPDCLAFERNGKKHITYAGYHELAYLHPNRFEPDPSILKEIGLNEGERFFVLRFNVFKAHHDFGAKGLSLTQKRELIDLLAQRGKVFITTERGIDPEFSQYQLRLSPEKIHSLLYYATMFIGDSQTMTSEAAVLGTPAIKCNSFAGKLSVPNEIEYKYNLCYSFPPEDFDKMLEKIKELLRIPNLKQKWQKRRQKMLSEKIDVTAFIVWFVENYPASAKIMKIIPDYQWKFK